MSSATRESIFSDTDQFGNPLSTDSFGQTSYDINAQRQGILDEVMMQKWDKEDAPVKPATKKADVRSNYPSHFTPWLIEQLEGQRKRKEFFQSAKDTISDTAGDLYQGAQTLGSDIYDKGTGAAKTLMDLVTPEEDNRTHRQQMIDNQTNIVEPVKKFITDLPELAGDIYKGTVAPLVTGKDSAFQRFSDNIKEPWSTGGDNLDTARTALGNIPGQLGEAYDGLTELMTNPEARQNLSRTIGDFTLGSMEKLNDGPLFDTELGKEQAPKRIKTVNDALSNVKDIMTNPDKLRGYLSQNPLDVAAGGVATKIGAQKLGKTLGPKLGDKIEQHLMDIGAIKQMAPPKRINRGSMPEAEFEAMKAKVREKWAVGKTRDAAENRRRGSQASMEIRERVKRYDLEAKKIDEGLLGQTPKQTKTLYHTSAKELDIGNKKEPAWFALEEKHATDGWAKNLEFEGEKPHVYKTEFTGNLIKRNDARKLFDREGLDFDDYEAFLTENPGSKEVLSMKGTQLLKKEGFDGLEYLDYDPRDFQKDLKAAIVFEPKKVIDSSNIIKPPKVGYHKSTAKFDKIDPSKQQISSMGTAHYVETNPAKKDDFPGMFLYEENLPGDIKMKTINWGDGGQSTFVLNALQKIQKEVKFDLGLDKNPVLSYTKLVKNLGSEQKAQALLIKHGIKGSRSDTVYAIYDSKTVELTKRNGKQLNKKPPKFKQGILDFD
jgi:hypothetical protein